MSALDQILDRGDEQRDRAHDAGRAILGYLRIGVWSVGWLLAKSVVVALSLVAGIIVGIGWVCARTVPGLKWCRSAFLLGWESGLHPSLRGKPR